jgi:predicted RNase H-like nuclease
MGVDGCRGGWLAVQESSADGLTASVHKTFAALLGALPAPTLLAIDIPVGLPEVDARACDMEVRACLGRTRGCSVFPAPLRATLAARTYAEACRIRYRLEGKKMSRQAYGILDKVREVDGLLHRCARKRVIVAEVHPEMSFAELNGAPLLYSKRKPAGRAERRLLIEQVWQPDKVDRCRNMLAGQLCAVDDLYDALVSLWSARRIVNGRARVFPVRAQPDGRHWPMMIYA